MIERVIAGLVKVGAFTVMMRTVTVNERAELVTVGANKCLDG